MKIEKIIYGKSIQLTNDLWEKIGVEISMDDTEDVERARLLAKEAVEHIFQKNNPSIPLAAIQVPTSLPEIKNIRTTFDDEVDEEFVRIKEQMNKCEFQEEADAILKSSPFRYNIELKNIVNSKPQKQ